MNWFTLQHMFLSSWFLSSVFQTSKVKSKGWGNASVDLDEMRGNCRLLYGFYMLYAFYMVHYSYSLSFHVHFANEPASCRADHRLENQAADWDRYGWGLGLIIAILGFFKLKFGQFDYTRLTGDVTGISLVDPQQNLKSCSFTIMYGQQWWIMVSQWSINSEPTGNLSLSNSSIQKVVFHYPIGYWLYIYGIIWFYHDPHCLNWGCNWNYPCTTCETLYDVLYFHDMLNILSHIFNISLYVMEYHGISLRHILPTPIDTERARHRAPRPTPCCTARQLGQGPKCGATRRG